MKLSTRQRKSLSRHGCFRGKPRSQHTVDAEGAQKTLLAAHRMEPGVLKPMDGAAYRRLKPVTERQARTLIAYHEKNFQHPTDMRLFADELCSALQFSQETSSNEFEATVDNLACFIGIGGQRPERDYGKGPDNLWALPDNVFLIIECKHNATSKNGISKRDVGQLGQSVAWFNGHYPGSTALPLSFTVLALLIKAPAWCPACAWWLRGNWRNCATA